ncbi:MAG: single-stranded-DNA-specific exonuclease RecJ [Candidatus Aminicenantes bacterium]|nr:single-stranded-DNA-specific exonuclease RecJ [Candidatus Aminicenantes bacterium]
MCYFIFMDDAVWTMPPPSDKAASLAAALDLPVSLGQVLINRGLDDPEAAWRFLSGGPSGLHDPFLMPGMAAAVERIERAAADDERILVIGDYDVDGILSAVMLHRALSSLGAAADVFIPDRLRDGYGIKTAHAAAAVERGARLVISVDCGVKDLDFVRAARERGVDVIITDHHQPGPEVPEAVAVLNPALPGSAYPDPRLAGVGVAFKLIQALLARSGREDGLDPYWKFAAIGTIADVADLRGENRILVKEGLRDLGRTSDPGLRSLIEACGLGGRRISESDIGFRLGPRINAAGRMGETDLAVRLFFSASPAETAAVAERLNALNARRQVSEEKIRRQASDRIRSRGLADRYRILILGDEGWPRGIIGIVASRLKDEFLRPVILMSYDGDKAFGSGRSLPGFSLIDGLAACGDIFLSSGGHPAAVGCTLERRRVPAFREVLNRVAEEGLSRETFRRRLRLDARLQLAEIDARLWNGLSLLDPYGVGNPRPVFLAEGVDIIGPPKRLQGRHAKFLVRRDGKTFEAIAWERAAWTAAVSKGDRVDLAFSLQTSAFFGEEQPYLGLAGLRRSS